MSELCTSCGAPILWAYTQSGRLMPLDAERNPDGRWRLFGDTPRVDWVPVERRVELADQLYVAHWATCPYADKHRRSRR